MGKTHTHRRSRLLTNQPTNQPTNEKARAHTLMHAPAVAVLLKDHGVDLRDDLLARPEVGVAERASHLEGRVLGLTGEEHDLVHAKPCEACLRVGQGGWW